MRAGGEVVEGREFRAGREVVEGSEMSRTLVRLSKMKISPKKFASQKQCDVFTQYRGYLSMERQAAINEALQQDFVWTKSD